MNNRFKVIVCCCLALAMCLGFSTTSHASHTESSHEFSPGVINSNQFADLLHILDSIPILVAEICSDNETERILIRSEVQDVIAEKLSSRANNTGDQTANAITAGEINVVDDSYVVTEATDSAKANMLSSPLFAPSLMQYCSLIEAGVEVKSITFYMKSNPLHQNGDAAVMSTNSNTDSEAYWEENCNYLGTYNGYKFLYLESSGSISTGYHSVDNISPSINWANVSRFILQSFVELFSDDVLKSALACSSLLSSVVDFVDPPLEITYGSASSSYMLVSVDGDLYVRDILLQDKLDRIDGYAYYSWAATQQIQVYQSLQIKYPISQRTATTYNYAIASGTGSMNSLSTAGFYGYSGFYETVLEHYRYVGYQKYEEYIDIPTFAASLMTF